MASDARVAPAHGSGADTEWVDTTTGYHQLRMLQDHQRVLLAEVQHRTRNLLAVVQSLAHQNIKSSHSVKEFAQEYESRLGALVARPVIARAHG